jgi:hypothetical protein
MELWSPEKDLVGSKSQRPRGFVSSLVQGTVATDPLGPTKIAPPEG